MSVLLSALESSFQGVIDLCLKDLQQHGHRQLLLTDEEENELILGPTQKGALIDYKPLMLWFLGQRT